MFKSLKRRWRSFADAEPGHRFRQRYNARRRGTHTRLSSVLTMLGGIGLILIGTVLLVVPGPGIPFVAVGVALMAQQIKWLATAADWLELRLRTVVRGLKRMWQAAPVALRVVAATVALLAGTAAGYGAYRIMFS